MTQDVSAIIPQPIWTASCDSYTRSIAPVYDFVDLTGDTITVQTSSTDNLGVHNLNLVFTFTDPTIPDLNGPFTVVIEAC